LREVLVVDVEEDIGIWLLLDLGDILEEAAP
jgi:hypothetical protein